MTVKTYTPNSFTRATAPGDKSDNLSFLRGNRGSPLGAARAVSFDWQLLDEDAATDAPVSAAPATPAHRRGPTPLVVAAALLLVLAVSAGLYLWRLAENGAQLLEAELNAAVTAETWRTAGSAATVQVQDITYFGDVASVLVTTTQVAADGRTQTARQRRFYQTTAAGWTPALPAGHAAGSPLGADQSYTTACCVFAYSRIDAAAVAAVAADIDALYTDLRQDYGLPAQEPVVIAILTAPPPYPPACHRRGHVCIASPALAALPAEIDAAAALQLWLLNELAYQVRREALEDVPLRDGWQVAATALLRLALRRHSADVAAWEADLATWLYGRAQGRRDGQVLAQELAQLCDAHRTLAQLSERYGVASLFLCTAPPAWVAPEPPPVHLYDLVLPAAELEVTAATWQDVVAFQTVLDYADATYGWSALPKLVAGFRYHDTWADLIPAAFGVSAAEFEAGWQRYLAAQYGAVIAVDPEACPSRTHCAQAAAPHALDAVTVDAVVR